MTEIDAYGNISTDIDITEEEPVSRVQLAINVDEIDTAIDFYSKLFDARPAKVRPGYANFAIDSPPLKLVLIENAGAGGTLNHLGVEVESADVVVQAGDRLEAVGLVTKAEEGVECCYATQDKVWVTDPDGAQWEVYTVLGDSDVMHVEEASTPAASACCGDGATACC